MLAVDWAKIRVTKSHTSGLQLISAEAKEAVFFSPTFAVCCRPKDPGVLSLSSGVPGSQHDQYISDNPSN